MCGRGELPPFVSRVRRGLPQPRALSPTRTHALGDARKDRVSPKGPAHEEGKPSAEDELCRPRIVHANEKTDRAHEREHAVDDPSLRVERDARARRAAIACFTIGMDAHEILQ